MVDGRRRHPYGVDGRRGRADRAPVSTRPAPAGWASDPGTSVVDPWCRVWGHDNVRVVDASVHVTNGGVNPVLTVFANAYRVLDQMTR